MNAETEQDRTPETARRLFAHGGSQFSRRVFDRHHLSIYTRLAAAL